MKVFLVRDIKSTWEGAVFSTRQKAETFLSNYQEVTATGEGFDYRIFVMTVDEG